MPYDSRVVVVSTPCCWPLKFSKLHREIAASLIPFINSPPMADPLLLVSRNVMSSSRKLPKLLTPDCPTDRMVIGMAVTSRTPACSVFSSLLALPIPTIWKLVRFARETPLENM